MRNQTSMSAQQLQVILKGHSIPVSDWPAMRDLVFYGKCSKQLRYNVNHVSNYVDCLNEVLAVLSRPYAKFFPPALSKAS
jgi:hypothetical protein